MKLLEYKGYHSKIEFDYDDNILRGKIEGIKDFVDFEATDSKQIVEEFHSAVDDYLEFCESMGKNPEKEYRGIFNVRVSADLHRRAALRALEENRTLNAVVESAIREYLKSDAYNMEKPVLLTIDR